MQVCPWMYALDNINYARCFPCSFIHSWSSRVSSKTFINMDVTSDALIAADQGKLTLLGMFDLSAALDCVDPDILLSRPKTSFGFAESWILDLGLLNEHWITGHRL